MNRSSKRDQIAEPLILVRKVSPHALIEGEPSRACLASLTIIGGVLPIGNEAYEWSMKFQARKIIT